jgi:N12 class adenine-specific DNA methylase
MDDRNYNSHIWKLLKDNGANVGHPYQFRAHLGVDEYNTANRKSNHVYSSNKPTGPSVPSDWGQLDTDAIGSGKMVGDVAKERATETEGNIQAMNDDVTNPHVKHAVQQGVTAQKNRLNNTDNQHTQQYGANWHHTAMLDKGIKGDVEAQKASGMPETAQQMQDNLQYEEATGKPLHNVLDVGMDKDRYGDITGSPAFAPTVQRDEQGNLVTDENGQPLIGMTSNEGNVREYGQQAQDEVVGQKKADIAESAKDGSLADESNKLFDALTSSDPQTKADALHRLREIRSLGDDNANSILMKAFVDRQKDQNNEDLSNAKMQSDQDAGTDIAGMGALGKNEGDPYLVGAKEDTKNNVGTYAAIDNMLNDTESHLKEFHKEQDEQNSNWLVRNGAQTARRTGKELTDINNWDPGVTALNNSKEMLQAVEAYKHHNANSAQMKLLQASALNNQVKDKYPLSDAYELVGQTTGQMIPFMVQIALGGAFGLGKVAAKSLSGTLARNLPKLAGKKFMGKTFSAISGRLASDMVDAGMTTVAIQGQSVAADTINRHIGDAQGGLDNSGQVKYTGQRGGESWGKSLYKATADAMFNNWSEYWGEYLPSVGHGMNKVAQKALDKVHLGAVNRFVAGADRSKGFQIYKNIRNRFELQGPFREWMEEMLGNSASAIATGDQSLSDIWSLQNMKDTALALSLGCGFGSITGGAAYLADVAGSKHSVHKAANRAAQAFGDKWDSVKDNVDRELDNAVSSGDNESVTDKITPQSMTPEQKKALSSYAMNRMYYRGMVYGVNAMMNDPQKPKDEKQVETSYIRGTDVDQPDDMNNIKREYVLQRQKVSSMVGDSAIADVDKDPMSFISNTNADQSKQQAILDYTNAKAAYDGMINNARDDIESRVEDSNAAVDSHVNKSDNLIHPATMKLDDRPVYVVSGKMQMMQDGSMVDKANSDDSIIIRDGATGKLEMTSADQVQSVDEPIDPEQEKQEAANNIRQQFSQEKAEQIDGVLPFNTGDNYTFLGDDGKQHAAQIIGPDQNQENVLAVIDGNQQAVSIAKQELQQGVDNYKETNVQSNNSESNQAQPNIGDDVQVNGDNGAPVHGLITGYDDLENKYMVQTDSPVNGKITQPYTSDQLISPSTDDANIRTENGNKETDNVNNITDSGNFVPDNGNSTEQDKQEKDVQQTSESEKKKEQPQVQQRAIDRIPMQNVSDNKGNITAVHNWEQAAPQDTYDALKEVYQNNEDITKHKIGKRIDRLDKQIKDIQKKQDKLDDSDDFDADIANADTYKQLADGKEQLEQQKKYWQAVQSVPANRQIDAEKKADEERKAAIEANEKAKAEEEENARAEHEKLKGVPDVTNDKPADARSRGFRSVNGNQIQRQDAIEGLTGKESNVKFSNKDTVQGHLKVIDADQLQPSHINGQRNPAFFIDEAQPKNRTDNVSSMAAEKIASNINPKEITGDGSAYQFSAPTVNTHGEVIQGNNRSDALKLMYSSPAYSEAQNVYKKYLMDHAEENGLDKEALSKMQHPVMVNELNVPDEEAIRLGQLTSKDNESGGVERIDPVTASRTLGNKVGRFANILLGSNDEDESINDLMAANGNKAITWLSNQGAISPTQVQSAFDTKGNLTPEAKMDLQNILKQSLFQGGVSDLPTMFNTMPAKAQKAILSTFMRDFDSAEDDRILPEIQNAIEVWYEASKSAPEFAQAKNYEEAKRAMQGYTHQTSLTESSLPTEHYSNLAFELACRLQGLKMKGMQQTLSDYFDLVQGKTQPDLFGGETPGEQLKRADAIRKVFDIEYKPINNKYNGQERSNDVDSDAYESKQRRQREPGNDKDRGPDTQGTESAERGGGIENNVQDQGNLHEGGRSKEQVSKGSHSSSESGNGETTELKNNDHSEKPSVNKAIEEVRKDVDTHPTEAQIEAGNYKKGHLKIDGYDISIENPKGSYREGHDAGGKEWKVKMNYDYGYLKGTEGTDGDHIDVYLSNSPTDGNVYVVDQVDQKTGKFDEHKVMYGFPSMEAARKAYASQYEKGWKIGPITEVSREEFKKWIDSSHRKTKPFVDYRMVQNGAVKTVDTTINPQKNRLVTDERYEELKKRLKAKLNNLNMGIDPEILAIGTEMAVYHIEKGARKFADYAKGMIADMGDAIRPYLKAFYNGARDLPEMDDISNDMSPYDEVRTFNVATIGKEGKEVRPSLLDTAEQISNEATIEQHKPTIQQAKTAGLLNGLKKKEQKPIISDKKDVSLKKEPGLFDGFFDSNSNKKENKDGLQRTNESRSKRLSTNDSQSQRGSSTEQTGSGERSREENQRLEQRGGRKSTEPDRPVQSGLQRLKNQSNNHAQRGKDYAPHDVDSRIQANIDAIELMQKLITEGRKATSNEMSTLRKFSGWGGLGKAFKEDDSNSQKLRDLLGDDAYDQAIMSRNSAYYTPAHVIDTLWDIAKSLGFKGGNVLEGSAGIGNILGLMPKEMSDQSNIHAVEIDGTSGNILSLLYPDAKVDIQGFEKTKIPNGSVDLAITNVPFVTGLRVQDTTGDKDLSQKFHDIHDFCIAKNVRKLRDGGIGIFITSNGTLDNSQKLRNWITSDGNADAIEAFRMNNETFGGTSATSDIIVIRKRLNGKTSAHAIDISNVSAERTAEYDTGEIKKGKTVYKQLPMVYNAYFINHPENMGGVMNFGFENGDTFRPTSKGLFPQRGINQKQRMEDWVSHMKNTDNKVAQSNTISTEEHEEKVYEDLGPDIKEGSLLVNKDGQLCVATYGQAVPLNDNGKKVKGHSKVDCFNSYTAIKDTVNEVLNYESTHEDDKGLQQLLDKLNKVYDNFIGTYGHFNKNTAISFLKNDIDYSTISALESYKEYNDDRGSRQFKYTKSDIFSKRVVTKETEPKPTNVKEGIVTSIYKFGRVDLPFLSQQLNKSEEDLKHDVITQGLGFENPVNQHLEVSYEYLSGNVREKLDQAKENNEKGQYNANIKALQKVIPMNIPSHLIDFTLGSSWLEPSLYDNYIKDKTGVDIKTQNIGGTWIIPDVYDYDTEKNRSMGVHSDKLNKTIFGHDLITAAMQNKSIVVSHTYKDSITGESTTITDKDATQNCATKIDEIRSDFKEWARSKMQQNPEMAEKYEKIYNDKFNNYVPKEIPDNFVPEFFSGANHEIHLRPHQAKAAVRGTTQNILLAHEVGTGKTFTLITTAMEMRRLGTANKPMIVVQNATVGQFVSSAKSLYPKAKILTLEDGDRDAEGRKAFYAKIKYNDWDMIVIPQSTLERIPDSDERQISFIQDKIQEKMDILEQMKDANADNFAIRNAQNEVDKLNNELGQLSQSITDKHKQRDAKKDAVTKQNAEVRAREMLDRKVDDVDNFDKMGIDALLVDEAHEYKHLGFATAMTRGVKGIDPSFSKKSQGVYLKCQSIMEKTGGKNVIFATGTPISNTAAEIWTFMRYLMPADVMKQYDIYYFDDFARNFGNISQHTEFTTSGKYKDNNRFIGYLNLPELVRIWSGASDTVLTDEASDLKTKIPELEGGKATDVYLPQTRALRSVMKFVRSELDKYDKMSGKEKRANSAIPLKMYSIAKAAAIDPRLVMEDAEDEANSKTNAAVKETVKALDESKNYKGTCAIFADNYQNKQSGFNLYDEIRRKLIAAGVPEKQIVIMRPGMSIKKKEDIFSKVNAGDVRVIMGSTSTLGTGVNIQERLKLLIHMDAPNRPMDYTQRMGRILRQGNLHKAMNLPVRVIRFGVEDSLDVTAYQRLKTKGAIADSIMHGKRLMENSMENRSIEEEDDQFGDTVAQLSGSQYALLKQQAEREVRKLEAKKKQWEADQIYIHHQKPRLKGIINDAKTRIEINDKNLQQLKNRKLDEGISVGKHVYKNIDAMADFFKDYNKNLKESEISMRKGKREDKSTGTLQMKVNGFDFVMHTDLTKETEFKNGNLASVIHRTMTYSCPELNLKDIPVRQGYLRNALDDIKENVLSGKDFKEQKEYAENDIKRQEDELSQIEKREGKPFQFTDDLQKAQDRFEDYNEKMKDELEAKEAKYAKMDNEVKAATKLSDNDNTDDTRYREGISFDDGQGFAIHKDYNWDKNKAEYSVDGLNDTYPSQEQLLDAFRNKYENYVSSISPDGNRIIVEPWSKYLKPETGKYTKEQQAHIEQKTNNAQAAIDKFAHKLNLDNNVSVLTSTDHLEGRRAKAKGWYDLKTGKIVVVLPNHTSIDDVIRTLLHEGVAHYGLRKLFGQHFNDFLNNVYINSNEEVRKQIANLALKKYNGDFSIATEEHLASLAEDTDFERAMQQGWWGKVKDLFLNMLAKAGIKLKHALSDNDLRYVLWRSYKNLEGQDPYRNIFDKAEDISTQNHLGVGNYAKSEVNTENVADTDRFRDKDDDELGNVVKGLREEYDNVLSKSRYQIQEALQDSMLSLKKLMGIIQKHSGQKEIADWENPYMAENALSSRDQDEANRYARDYYTPLMKSLRNLQNKEGVSMEQISDYAMAKHGIERNREMAVRNAITDHKTGNIDLDQLKKWNQRKNDIREKQNEDWYHKQKELDGIATNEFGADLSARDYSGLTSLYDDEIDNHDDVSGATFDAYRDVDAFEKNHNTQPLDTAIHKATQATLDKMYTSGLISKATLDNINQMYDYYVPLRGFNEKTADEVYAYIRDEKSAFNAPMKRANGRSSKADNPFAYIANMADSAILQGNRNLMKQQFLNFIQNRPSDLVSISDMWIRKDPATGDWVTTFPNIPDNATPEEVNDIVEEFNKQMEKESEKEDPQVKRIRGNVNVPYRLLSNELSSHQVIVKRGGHEYVLTINANPRASMALNGLTNPHSDYTGVWGVVKNAAEYVNKELSAFYTTRNPDFIASNFVRDAIYGNSMVWVKEKPRYAINFNKNYVKYNPAFMARLYHKYNHNTLDMNDKIEKEFNNFMRGGGETGYSNIKDIENTKKKLQKDLNNSQLHKAKALLDRFDIINRSVENCTRFAAYMTSREENKSIQRSVYDAKEISVNFNKKGSGGTFLGKPGQTRLGNFAAGGSELFRTMFVFFNAGVQGSTNLIRAAKEHPAKFSSLVASYFILGFVAPALMGSAGGNGDDDKDHSQYDDLPDYVRRSNVIIKGPGKSYISLPLPVEFRTLYGMGELANNVITGKERLSNSELALEMAKQVSQALPVDLLEGEGFDPVSNMVPSFVSPVWQAYRNKDWTGVPIYKDHEFNKNMPEWTKAPSKTNRHLVDLSKAINEATGGDDYKKGWADNILNNPAVVESIAEGYFGGAISFLNKASNSIDMGTGKMNFDWRNIPIANRLVKSGDKHTHERAINQEFYDNLNMQRQMTQQENGYKKIISAAGTSAMDRAEYLDKLNVLYKSDEYKNMQTFKYLHSEISKLQRAMNDNGIEDSTIEQQIWDLKEQANQIVRDNGKELK